MRILLDANIVIDILAKRDGYVGSREVLRFCEAGRADGYVTTTTVTDVMYILRKHINPSHVKDAVQTLLSIVDVAGVLKNDIVSAFTSEMMDDEDAVQASCATRLKADFIITRNVRDFKDSAVSAILPEEFLKLR